MYLIVIDYHAMVIRQWTETDWICVTVCQRI